MHPDLDFLIHSAIFIKHAWAFQANNEFSSVGFSLCLLWSGGMLSLRAGKEEEAAKPEIK